MEGILGMMGSIISNVLEHPDIFNEPEQVRERKKDTTFIMQCSASDSHSVHGHVINRFYLHEHSPPS